MTTHRENDREVCDRCGESWDRKSTTAIYGHTCADNNERDERIALLESRIDVLESQVRSLQSAAPKGIDHG